MINAGAAGEPGIYHRFSAVLRRYLDFPSSYFKAGATQVQSLLKNS